MNEPMSIQEIFPGAAIELPEEDEFGQMVYNIHLTLCFSPVSESSLCKYCSL